MPDVSLAPPHVTSAWATFDQRPYEGLVLWAASPAGAATSCVNAWRTLSRAPVATRPVRLDFGSAESRRARLSSAVVSAGRSASTSAAAPATCGAAIEVPSKY